MGARYFSLMILAVANLLFVLFIGLETYLLPELLLLILFVIASSVLLHKAYRGHTYSIVGGGLFLVALINVFLVRSMMSPSGPLILFLIYVAALIATIGFIMSMASSEKPLTHQEKQRIIDRQIIPKIRELQQTVQNQTKEPWDSVIEILYPGKFMGSKAGKTYHSPSCPIARNIKQKDRIWFDDAVAAAKKKYKKHTCI